MKISLEKSSHLTTDFTSIHFTTDGRDPESLAKLIVWCTWYLDAGKCNGITQLDVLQIYSHQMLCMAFFMNTQKRPKEYALQLPSHQNKPSRTA